MVAVDHAGLYDLKALGHPSPIVLTQRRRASAPISYRLSRTALRRYPYVKVFLRCTVRLEKATTQGGGYVDLRTGSGPSASAEFLTRRSHGRLHVDWDTVDVNGETDHRTTSRVMRVEYPNYMLFDDARPGTHQLRFTLEAYEGLRFERVTISPSSGIALTKTSPFPARLTVSERGLEAGRPTVGKAVTIVVRVENRGRGPARDVPLAMSTDPGLRFVEHGYDHPIRLIPVGHAVERRVRLVPRTAGRHVIRLSAGAGRATSSGELSFAAVRPTGHSGRLWLWLVGGCAAVGACTLAIRRRILGDQS